jgi:hypothetical protein
MSRAKRRAALHPRGRAPIDYAMAALVDDTARPTVWRCNHLHQGSVVWGFFVPGWLPQYGTRLSWREAYDEVAHTLRRAAHPSNPRRSRPS